MSFFCRHCGAPLERQAIDLGHQPPSNAYLDCSALGEPERTYPLKVFICERCWLVQLPAHAAAAELFPADYAYLSSTSSTWCAHAKRFVETAVKRFGLDESSHVVELASNDGYLLQYVQARGISCLGVEPTRMAAELARLKGIPTLERFFGLELAKDLQSADLVVANNVLAHVPDINDFLAGIACLLKSEGRVSIEFPHLLQLLRGNQFDTIYHEHYSYLSLRVVARISKSVGLMVVDAEKLSTHGGSLRIWLAHANTSSVPTKMVQTVLAEEENAGLETIRAWSDFQKRAVRSKNQLVRFLIDQYESRSTVFGYGAAAKGNTLLNFAGIRSDLLPAVADRAISKQGKYLPGSHIPVISPESLLNRDPQTLLVLPWNLIHEVSIEWPGRNLVTAIPELSYFS